MCGIAGLLELDRTFGDAGALVAMTAVIRHRGPDDVGYLFGNTGEGGFALLGDDDTPRSVYERPSPWAPGAHVREAPLGPGYNLGLANRRLAIVDLSPAGHQPMCNEDRSVWVVFNGEIYNAPELRATLEAAGHRFVSDCDTEAILHAYEQWGDDCFGHFHGMWGLAIWDIRRRRLVLSRDRVGIKPLYYYHDGRRLAFGSELKSLLALDIPRRANQQAIYAFLSAGESDHAEMTFFAGIRPLLPAHLLVVDLATGQLSQRRYWSLDLERRLDARGDDEYAEAFRALFEEVVRGHLISDVPVGTCLSGGLDSSSLVGMINQLIRARGLHVVGMEARQKTFSARYDDPRYDEGRHIDAVVQASGVEAHMTYPSAEAFQASWQELFRHLEEPFVSTSIFAQWCVFKLAREAGMRVTLDGQGGDELLAGYPGFFPYHFADLALGLRWRRLAREFQAHAALHGRSRSREARNLLSNLLPAGARQLLKRRLATRPAWMEAAFFAQAGGRHEGDGSPGVGSRLARGLEAALSVTPLPSLLRFDDRNSMAHSIESRVPFLDHRLIEFCFALPADQKIRHGVTKHILRQAMAGIVPEAVLQRHDKMGFSTPQREWLRGPLAPWLREVFESQSFRQRPYVQAAEVLKLLDLHASGRGAHEAILWRCLAVELWHRAMEV